MTYYIHMRTRIYYETTLAERRPLRRLSNGEQMQDIIGLAMRSSLSVDFCGYWHRAQAA